MYELTVFDAAARLAVSERRIRVLCEQGRIKARRFGKAWAINARSLEKFATEPRAIGKASKLYGKAKRKNIQENS